MSDFPKHLKNVAIYLRKSRADFEAESRGEGETLNKHRTALLSLAERHGFSITHTFEEIVSGERILDRPEMQRLLQAVHRGTYSAVLCMDLDRLGRGNMVDQGLIQEAFKSTNTLIITPRKVYDLQDEMDEEWSEFEAFLARRELKMITRRLQRGRKQSAGLGKSISRKPPFGYQRDRNLVLSPHPETAPVVQMIFELAADGYGTGRIANRLTALGIPTPTGNDTWQRSSVYAILKNPVYLGKIVWGRMKYVKNPNAASSYDRVRQHPDHWIVRNDAHEPLVDDEHYLRYVTRLEKTPKLAERKELSNSLAALIYCAECGKAMTRQPTRNRPSNRLVCRTSRCATRSASVEMVESRVIHVLREVFCGVVIQTVEPTATAHIEHESLLSVLTNKLVEEMETVTKLSTQKAALYDLLEQKVYDVETYLERNRVLEERLKKANACVVAAQEELGKIEGERLKFQQFIPKLAGVMEGYDQARTVQLKNQLLRSLIQKITYTRHAEWSAPDQFELDITLRI